MYSLWLPKPQSQLVMLKFLLLVTYDFDVLVVFGDPSLKSTESLSSEELSCLLFLRFDVGPPLLLEPLQ